MEASYMMPDETAPDSAGDVLGTKPRSDSSEEAREYTEPLFSLIASVSQLENSHGE